jgi:hypothetical protein
VRGLPGDDRIGAERELRDDLHLRACPARVLVLPPQRVAQGVIGHIAMAFRVASHPDLADPVLLDEARLEDLQAARERTHRLGDVARHDEDLLHAGVAGQPSQEVVQERQSLDAPGDDVGHRLHTLGSKSRGEGDRIGRVGAGHVGDEEFRAGGHDVGESLDALPFTHGRFDRIPGDEVLNGSLVHGDAVYTASRSAPRRSPRRARRTA